MIAFGAPGFGEDVVEIPQIAQDYNFNPPRATEHKFVGDEADQDYATKSNLPLHLDIDVNYRKVKRKGKDTLKNGSS